MLRMMTQALRRMGVVRSVRPRTSRGTRMDRVRASTDCTNVVADSLCTQSGTSPGAPMQRIRWGTKGSMSRLPMAVQHLVSASVAAVRTVGLRSTMQLVTTGTISGR